MEILRERLKFRGAAKLEFLEDDRYTLQHQTIDNGKHPDEVKSHAEIIPFLVEVFDENEITYQNICSFRNEAEYEEILQTVRNEIVSGKHASQEHIPE